VRRRGCLAKWGRMRGLGMENGLRHPMGWPLGLTDGTRPFNF